ncbi:MAG: 50S ribosomal protein L15 [Holosporaceae bacterium]|jgi:large subunit ribosomal protein L15|nr:50S ribosomal protein L15 [Holosporaceae bacterium]
MQMNNFCLNSLRSRHGIDKKALGRGIGSGCGKTSSYGHKGGKARSGRGKVKWFEGGQMPIYRRLPKHGFVSGKDRSLVAYINLQSLQRLCEIGKLSADQSIDITVLQAIGAVRNAALGIRLLGKGELKTQLNIVANYATAAAIRGVEAAGGRVTIIRKPETVS